jgi:HK97 family phage major capsid protein
MSKRQLSDLRSERGSLIDEMTALSETLPKDFDKAKFDSLESQVEAINDQINRAEKAQALQRTLAQPAATELDPEKIDRGELANAWRRYAASGVTPSAQGEPRPLRGDLGGRHANFEGYIRSARRELNMLPDAQKHFRNIGEMLQAVYVAYESRFAKVDPRLERANDTADRFTRAPTGASEVDPTGGGFLVQVDFASAIWMLAHDMGELLGRVNTIPISANANGLKIPGVDETSRATGSRWGGVQSYWAAEGTAVTASKPTFRIVEFDLKKLFSIMYMTSELLQDTSALTTIAGQAFSEEIVFMTEDAIYEGSGSGQPLGVIGAPATVIVAKEASQSAAGIVKENIDKMMARLAIRSRPNAVWFINQDVQPALQSLSITVGTGGAPVYLPPGGYSQAPYATIFGRPVIPVEYASTLGTVGDILLADMSQYVLVDKGGVENAMSMHVAFLTDEQVFRVTYRVDGRPMWNAPRTPFKGTNTISPFITLAVRP